MLHRLWDAFVDNAIALFMPLVCSYFALCSNPFLNISAEDADGLEKAGNALLAPVQYICAGREAVRGEDGTYEFRQKYDYSEAVAAKTALSAIALPPSLILGSAVKGLSYLSSATRARHASLKEAMNSRQVRSNLSAYRAMGIEIGDLDKTEFHWPEGHARRPGDQRHLEVEKKALEEIAHLLNEAQIPWWVDCGTCLGTYRYGGVIPWDYDLDVAVLLPDFDNVFRVLQKLDRKKYIVQDWSSREQPKSYIKVYIRESATLIDVYHFAIDPQAREISYILSLETNVFFPEWWKIRERRFTAPIAIDAVFPLKKSAFDGIEVNLPQDPKRYLQRYYGENLAPAKIYDPVTGNYERDLSHPYWQRAYAH